MFGFGAPVMRDLEPVPASLRMNAAGSAGAAPSNARAANLAAAPARISPSLSKPRASAPPRVRACRRTVFGTRGNFRARGAARLREHPGTEQLASESVPSASGTPVPRSRARGGTPFPRNSLLRGQSTATAPRSARSFASASLTRTQWTASSPGVRTPSSSRYWTGDFPGALNGTGPTRRSRNSPPVSPAAMEEIVLGPGFGHVDGPHSSIRHEEFEAARGRSSAGRGPPLRCGRAGPVSRSRRRGSSSTARTPRIAFAGSKPRIS